MRTIKVQRQRLAPVIAVVVSCVGLFSACGIGARNNYAPPPPPPPRPVSPIVASSYLLVFEPTAVGATSKAQQLTLRNMSPQAVPIEGVRIYPPDSFARTTNCAHQLAAGESCTVGVTFNPQNAGSLGSQINVISTGFKTIVIRLSGEGTGQAQTPKVAPQS